MSIYELLNVRMYSINIAALLLATSASLTGSIPTLGLVNITQSNHLDARGGITSTYCAYPRTYDLSMAPILMYENPVLISGMVIGPDPAGGSISAGYTYSTSFSVTGGISGFLGVDGM